MVRKEQLLKSTLFKETISPKKKNKIEGDRRQEDEKDFFYLDGQYSQKFVEEVNLLSEK